MQKSTVEIMATCKRHKWFWDSTDADERCRKCGLKKRYRKIVKEQYQAELKERAFKEN